MLRVTLLGAFRVSRGAAAVAVPGARLQALVVRLALAGGRPVEPGVLVDAIWAEDPPGGPLHALQALVSQPRRAAPRPPGQAWVSRRPRPPGAAVAVPQATGGYRLDVAAEDVDALRF